MEELIVLLTSISVLAMLSGVLGLGWLQRGKEIEDSQTNEIAAIEAGNQIQHELKTAMAAAAAKPLNELTTVIADNKAQWDQREEEHRTTLAEKHVRIATLNGRLDEARRKGDLYDSLMKGHEMHIGGKADVHGRGVEIVRECPCGNLKFTEPAGSTEGTGTT